MSGGARYDDIGTRYSSARRPDPCIAAQVLDALADAVSVVNVGAGTGSYEPPDRFVVAVEPSATMLAQRPPHAASAVQGAAEALPFPDGVFDAAMTILSVHHWNNQALGLGEMRRVSSRQIVFFFEPALAAEFWLIEEYFPGARALPSERGAPGLERLAAHLDPTDVIVVPIASDCTDGFVGCYWNRPEAYLEPVVQQGMSLFAFLDERERSAGTERLRADLASGAWDRRHGGLRTQRALDLGYRILVAGR